jgi:hypothetical protein
MRIIAWNANFNRHRRPFEAMAEILGALDPDLIVISETARPIRVEPGHIAWVGEKEPGLGIVARNGYSLLPHEANIGAPPLSAAYRVQGPSSLNLLAVWPIRDRDGPSYDQLLNSTLDHFAEFLKAERTVLIGDLNTSTRVDAQKKSHPSLVARLDCLGLSSLYHLRSGERHGEETAPTYRHGGLGKGLFHIDYAFLSQTLQKAAKIQVLSGLEWEARSDHYPIVVDILDAR